MITLSAKPPEIIRQVKSTRYSIARRYGRVTIEGHTYVYERSTDTLIRQDVYHQLKQNMEHECSVLR